MSMEKVVRKEKLQIDTLILLAYNNDLITPRIRQRRTIDVHSHKLLSADKLKR